MNTGLNPILSAALGSILRWALAMGAGYLVNAGIWTASEATGYVAAGSLGILALGLSFWNKYQGRVHVLTALAMPKGSTEEEMKAHVATGQTPAVTTPTDTAPKLGL